MSKWLSDYHHQLIRKCSKCFEKLIRDHICSVLAASLGPLQFTYCNNCSTDDAITFTLHTALSHLNKRNTYLRKLFVDYSSAFNTIVSKLVVKLRALGLSNSLCSWILDFLTGRRQVVRVGSNISSPLTRNTRAPQGCVLSPLLYSLYTHDCVATHSSNIIVKFTDDTTVIGMISDDDESAYREEVHILINWPTTTSLWTSVRPRSWWWISGGGPVSTPHHHRCGAGQQHQVPRRKHHRGPHLD